MLSSLDDPRMFTGKSGVLQKVFILGESTDGSKEESKKVGQEASKIGSKEAG